MRVIFIRHGEPNYDLDCLTETGKIQAGLLAKRLKNAKIDEMWASPYGRAQETAKPTSIIRNEPFKTLEFMHEVDWESTDGQPLFADGNPWEIIDEMVRKGEDLQDPNWKELPYFKTNSILQRVDYVEKNFDQWLAGYGYVRDGYCYNHLTEEKEHRNVAIFCHGGSTTAAIAHMLNILFPHACSMLHLEFTSITVIHLDNEKGRVIPWLELVNDAGHLNQKDLII